MNKIVFTMLGIIFGLALTKGEAISWFRMQEMFRFEGFHMYGIFFTAIPVGALTVFLLRAFHAPTLSGEPIQIPRRDFHPGLIWGGLIFGFGWALTGACPGPLYAQIGSGYTVTIITFFFALAGTWAYGLVSRYPA